MLQARNKSETKTQSEEEMSLLLDRFDNGNGDDNGDDDKDNEGDNEAYPSLLAHGACRIHSLVCVLKTVTTVRRNRLTTNAKTCPTSVSFSTVAAVVSMTLMVSSCCSTRTLIYKCLDWWWRCAKRGTYIIEELCELRQSPLDLLDVFVTLLHLTIRRFSFTISVRIQQLGK